MMASAPVYPRFSFGKTISDTFSVIGGNFGLLAVLSFLLSALPSIVFNYAYLGSFAGLDGASASDLGTAYLTGVFVTAIGGGLLVWILFCLLEVAVIRASLAHFAGQRIGIGEAITFGLGKLLPVLAVSFLGWVAIAIIGTTIMLGYFLVVGVTVGTSQNVAAILVAILLLPIVLAPIFFFMIVWLVQVPAYVGERIGVFATFGRSWRLTSGARWRIFALCALYFVAIYIIFAVLFGIGIAAGGASMMTAFDPASAGGMSMGMLIPIVVMQGLSSMVATFVGLPGLAAIYSNLRQAKEGVNHDRIADVFG